MRRFLTIAVALFVANSTALADPGKAIGDAMTAGLGTLSEQERNLLAPYLKRGPVVLTEFATRRMDLPSVIYAARIHAPASTVSDVISRPQEYPTFVQALDSVEIESAYGPMMSYEWTWKVAAFTLSSRNVMTTFPSRGNPKPARFDVRISGGELGVGRMMWRIYAEGPEHAVVVFSSRLDMRHANYITEQLSKGGNALNRTINVTLATLMLLEVKEEAEQRAGTSKPQTPRPKPLRRPSIDMSSLRTLLGRGDLVLLDLEGETLHQVAVVGRSGSTNKRVRAVMANPESFANSAFYGSSAQIIERKDGNIRLKWSVPVPLINVGGEIMMRNIGTVVAVDGISGSFSEGQWRTDTHRYPGGEVGVVSWAQFDPADSSKFFGRLISGNTYFSHGLAAAIELMLIRTLRTRLHQFRR